MHFLSDDTRAGLASLADADGVVPDALARLRSIRSLIAALEADPATLQSVRDALADGASWEQIADAGQLKPAAAKWRW